MTNEPTYWWPQEPHWRSYAMPLPTQLPTPDETMVDDICNKLRGIYRIPITDGLGPAGGEEPENPNEFVRKFVVPPIQKRAADLIERLQSELAAANARADKSLNPHSLTSQELKVIDRHCDWQAFKHALGALNNYRSKKEPHDAT
jgi:hypothetical protein